MPEILIYDAIGQDWFGEGVTAKSIKRQLDEYSAETDITVRINSPGGDVFDGFAIFNLLRQHKATINVVIDGLAASAASVIAMAGDTVEMAENALLMIHNPYTFAVGDASEMLKTAEMLETVKDSIITSYQVRVALSDEELSNAMDDETWYSYDEALENGFVDASSEAGAPVDNVTVPWIKNAPKTLEQQPQQSLPEFRIAARARLKNIA